MSSAASPKVAAPSPIVPSGMWRNLSARPTAGKLPKGLDAAWNVGVSKLVPLVPRQQRYLKRSEAVVALEKKFADMGEEQLREQAMAMRERFRLSRESHEDIILAFAIVREVAWRQMGMRPYPVQIAAAFALYEGNIVEMATGEGKTLAATMPAAVAGWRGKGCHVITVNDYLANRDAEWMTPIYRFCGLRVASVIGQMPPPQRCEGYNADITYLTNKEVAADLLRDRIVVGRRLSLPKVLLGKIMDGHTSGMEGLVMRGLEYAIIDEADSILIDEAVTPLIISGNAPNAQQVEAFKEAVALAEQLEHKRDYQLNQRFRDVKFTRAGRARLAELTQDMGGIWAGVRRREELVNQAVQARDLYTLDKQYVVQDGKVVIVDEFTGRLMPDRTWRDGIHQAVEARNGVDVTPPKDTLARISFQRFFRLYRRLSGMTGTALEGQCELWQIYRVPVVRIPTHRPCVRTHLPTRIFATRDAKWAAIVEEIQQVHAKGRPILVGTRSVQASEHISKLLAELGLDHLVLNAVRHREEAQIVAEAGNEGRITVATNMAGRGTDIKLGEGVAEKGGLHVLATERHESSRIDRQLFGRAARQGDPGSAGAYLALEDELIQRYAPRWAKRILANHRGTGEMVSPVHRRLADRAQRRAQSIATRQRQAVLKADDWLDEFLGFAGAEG